MSEDEPRKTPRLPPVPREIPKCRTCDHYHETLVDNLAGGIKGFDYTCDVEDGLPPELYRDSIHPDSTGCIAHTDLSSIVLDQRVIAVWQAVQLDLDEVFEGIRYNPYAVNMSTVIKVFTHFQEAMSKIIRDKTEGEYFDMHGTNYDNPLHQATQELESSVRDLMNRVSRDLLDQLETALMKHQLRFTALLMRHISNYVESSITDLKHELLGKEEKPTTLMRILGKDGEPLSDEFKRMFGLE